ncbi:molybdate ABC transporter substrate-binding protein [Paenibacillus sp. Z6-24]
MKSLHKNKDRLSRPSMHRLPVLVLLMMLAAALSACGSGQSGAASQQGGWASSGTTELTVSAAASLTDSLQEIQQMYEQRFPNVKLTFNFAASGTLQKQIEQGAPADLFLSAGSKQMEALVSQKFIDPDHQTNLLTNELVLVIPKDSPNPPASLQDLTKPALKRLAVGTPESVPAGMYAQQTLQAANLWDSLQSRIVQTKDVKQVLSYVETGNADAGFVYKTDALESDGVHIAFTAAPDSHDPIVYPAGVLAGTAHREEAAQFYAYLQTDEAQAVFEKYGFSRVSSGS